MVGFLHSKAGGLIVGTLTFVVLTLAMVFATTLPALLGTLEGRILPVNEVTSVEIVDVIEGDAVVQGTYDKYRDCDFVSSQWYKGPEFEIAVERVAEVELHIAGEGLKWGPLRLDVGPETVMEGDIHVIAIHKCNGWLPWQTRTFTYQTGSAPVVNRLSQRASGLLGPPDVRTASSIEPTGGQAAPQSELD